MAITSQPIRSLFIFVLVGLFAVTAYARPSPVREKLSHRGFRVNLILIFFIDSFRNHRLSTSALQQFIFKNP
jgi:hypothetical protein